jgi:hypothetical protein
VSARESKLLPTGQFLTNATPGGEWTPRHSSMTRFPRPRRRRLFVSVQRPGRAWGTSGTSRRPKGPRSTPGRSDPQARARRGAAEPPLSAGLDDNPSPAPECPFLSRMCSNNQNPPISVNLSDWRPRRADWIQGFAPPVLYNLCATGVLLELVTITQHFPASIATRLSVRLSML